MPHPLHRRAFLRDTATVTTGLAVGAGTATKLQAADAPASVEFASRWSESHDGVWLGREYWANPLQDWRIAGRRIECINAAPDRNVHLLTRELAGASGELQMSVEVGRLRAPDSGQGDVQLKGKGSAGFRFGIQGPLADYRNALIYGRGMDAGLTFDGRLFLGELSGDDAVPIELTGESLELRLQIVPQGATYQAVLSAYRPNSQERLGQVLRPGIPPECLIGNIALVANFGATLPAGAAQAKGKAKAKKKAAAANTPDAGMGRFWFTNWRLSGSKLGAHDDRGFGPILFSQYSLSRGVLKLSAQMPPLGERDAQAVQLQIMEGGSWKTIADAKIDPAARTATFRIAPWPDQSDVEYRLVYRLAGPSDSGRDFYWSGTIRRDPVDQPVLTVADISCNTHAAFPNSHGVAQLAKLNPDLLAFVGDQFYESTGGFGIIRSPVDTAILDYLRKWYMHGWTWRDLLRDRPSLSLPDDHDVYQGNIWGESGGPREGTQEMGGYDMAPAWVNVVHRTQTSHHPDPYDPTPIRQNIQVYYGPLTYGRVSFAILADRMFKTGPEGEVPPTGGRGDHVTDPRFDPRTADRPGLELLGPRQMKFLEDWVADWRGADIKAVVSQTIFTAMATTHGGNRERLIADYDTNGWPQTARNQALALIRKASAIHLAGDQHLPAVIHYGIERHRDAGVAFAGPAINVGYPRWWEPTQPGQNRKPADPENTGDFRDHFGHPLTVLAVKNGEVRPRSPVLEMLQDRSSGFAVVRFDKPRQQITIECWPLLADPTRDAQFLGWPVTIRVRDNDGRPAAAHLPQLAFRGGTNPVVQVVDESTGELVYSLRVIGTIYQPHVFGPGKFTLRVGDPDRGPLQEFRGLEAREPNEARLNVDV